MTDQNLLLSENGYPNAPDLPVKLRMLAKMHAHWKSPLDRAAGHIEQLERELAEARKDAERYRFLEAQCRTGSYRGIISRAAIDAAMKDKP